MSNTQREARAQTIAQAREQAEEKAKAKSQARAQANTQAIANAEARRQARAQAREKAKKDAQDVENKRISNVTAEMKKISGKKFVSISNIRKSCAGDGHPYYTHYDITEEDNSVYSVTRYMWTPGWRQFYEGMLYCSEDDVKFLINLEQRDRGFQQYENGQYLIYSRVMIKEAPINPLLKITENLSAQIANINTRISELTNLLTTLNTATTSSSEQINQTTLEINNLKQLLATLVALLK